MSADIQKLFRTSQEMETIYRQLDAAGKADEPYVLNLERNNQKLIFFGCRHFNDVNDIQNEIIEHEWQLFVDNKNKTKSSIL